MKKKITESYREFAYRWRKEAVRVRPPMSEKEIVDVFVRVQDLVYYDKIMLLVGEKFAETVKIGENIKNGFKIEKIARFAVSPESSGLLKKKREDIVVVSSEGKKTPRISIVLPRSPRPSQNSYQTCHTQASHPNNPPPVYQDTTPTYQNAPPLNY